MSSPKQIQEQMLPRLRVALGAAALTYLAIAGYFFAGTVMANADAGDLVRRRKEMDSQAKELQAQVMKARNLTESPLPKTLNSISDLQARFQKLAVANKASLVEFRSSTEVLPYLTRFNKDTKEKGWNQIEAQASLKGPVRNVIQTLADLSDMQIPFEFNSLELARDEVNEAGDAQVIANVSFRVLTHAEAGK